ncbi:RHS repeat domain-containing protein [Streptomyces sp. NPDC002928]|uniref:RHS repeat domain-containing protein n=1 Tax=Streptomyces sp. NPDC002928 TaxID=3154440 RepID=UPI0033AD3F14
MPTASWRTCSRKASAKGRAWQFGYDTFANLKTVTDPKGVATTSVPDDYTTKYDYDSFGELTKATDANGNPTSYSNFGPTGYPNTITDANTDSYDVFGRPLVNTVPKDQDAGLLITSPAPVYDEIHQLTFAVNAKGHKVSYEYDKVGNTTKVIIRRAVAAGAVRSEELIDHGMGFTRSRDCRAG